MRRQFYHAIALCALLAAACGRPEPDTPPPAPAAAARAPASGAAAATATVTSDAVQRGKEIIEKIRAAAGGPKLTAVRSIEATGTSTMSTIRSPRTLSIRAMFPELYRQEEIPSARGGLGFAIGVAPDRVGWILGARFTAGSKPGNAQAMQDMYNRAGSQAMAGFLAGVNAPWLVDTGKFTPVASGTVEAGDDRSLFIVNLEGPLGRAGRLLIDPGTSLPRRFIEPPQPGPGGEAGRNELNFTYSDFRALDGVQLPHTIVRRVGNVITTWLIEKYTINPKLKPADFTKRVAAKTK
jgi:hypothetical protein